MRAFSLVLSLVLALLFQRPAAAAPATAGPTGARAAYTRNVAIVLYNQAEPLDWAGPFEVYNDAARAGTLKGEPAFRVYIVSKSAAPLDAQGVHVVPEYSIENAPRPDILVIPGGPERNLSDDPAFFAWAKKAAQEAEIAQSVCTGAFVLGKAGLLDGLTVTTFHAAIDGLQAEVPKARVESGRRFVDNGHVVTTAGISAGIDGSLHIVARLLGRRVADQVAMQMEYAWHPEPTLAMQYPYLNPSADADGRLEQQGDLEFGEKDYAAAERAYRTLTERRPDDADDWRSLGVALKAEGRHAEAAAAMVRGAAGRTGRLLARSWYEVAAEYAQAGRKDDAVAALRRSFDAGYPDRGRVATDPELAAVAQDPRVKELVAAQ